MNFIFNKNLEEIFELQNKLEQIQGEVDDLETNLRNFNFIQEQVNNNLNKIGGNIKYNGKNAINIKEYIISVENMEDKRKFSKEKNTAELEVIYNNISEQIKVYENKTNDAKQFRNENRNKEKLLLKLRELVEENHSFNYLVEPMERLLSEVEDTIYFSDYLINDNTIKELKKQRKLVQSEIKRNNEGFKMYSLEEKSKSIAIIKEYLSLDITDSNDNLQVKKKEIKQIKNELKVLKNSDDTEKIREISNYITELYHSVEEISSVVSDDFHVEGYKIKYIKKGNILQPMIRSSSEENTSHRKDVDYYIGSMARHTLIQLCGYLAFMKMLIENNEYPIIPILVIDHISKPFDVKNSLAIGKILSKAYETIGKENLQTFIFDDEDFENLGIEPDRYEDLVNDLKTGFNPFYFYSRDIESEDHES